MGQLAPRWVVLAIAGILVAGVAFVFVEQSSDRAQPEHRAQASIDIVLDQNQDSRNVAGDPNGLAAALTLAQEVNSEELRRDDRFVNADFSNGVLTFSAVESAEVEASSAAVAMRAKYQAADPRFDPNALLQQNIREAALVNDRIVELTPEPALPVEKTPAELAEEEATLKVLVARESALETKISELVATRLDATGDTELEDLDEQLASFETQLADLLIVLGPLRVVDEPPADESPTPTLPFEDQWTIDALEARLVELQAESATLIVADLTGGAIDLPAPVVTDESPNLTPGWLAIAVGFLAGVVISAGALLLWDRMRGVVWGGDDLGDLVVLAKGPSGSLLAQDQSDAAREERKKVVQAARTAIINSETAGHGSVVGFVSPPTTESLTSEALAFDVASSIGAVGRKVMVIDLAFSDQARETTAKHAEVDEALRLLFASGDSDLATIRSLATDVIAHAQGLTPSVAALVAESGTVDPSDILAGRPLGELVDQASLLYDFVLVVQPPRNLVPGSDSLHLLVQQQVLVATRGRTTVAELTSEVGASASGRPRILGVVLLTKSGLFRRLAGFRKSDPLLLERRIDPATNGAAWSTGATNRQGYLDGKHVSHPELSEAGESDLNVRQPVQSSISQSDSQ